jgi:hypothetical protein
LTTYKWTLLAEVKYGYAGHSESTIEKKIYLFGGINLQGLNTNDLFIFYPEHSALGIVHQKGQLPKESYGHGSAALDNSLFVFGGADANYEYMKDLHQLRIPEMEWNEILLPS